MANSWEMYAGHRVMQFHALGNFVSSNRIQVDPIKLWWNWIESRLNLAHSANVRSPILNLDRSSVSSILL